MFPTLNVRLQGLDPERTYNIYVDMVLAETSHLKYSNGCWQPSGQADSAAQGQSSGGFWFRWFDSALCVCVCARLLACVCVLSLIHI